MAISPPSDIVLDVAMAADPARRLAATSRLETLGGAARARLADAMPALPPMKPLRARSEAAAPGAVDGLQAPASFDVHRARLKLRADTTTTRGTQTLATAATPDKRREAMQKFEAMVMQTFISSMLPQNADTVYGKGTAGDVWKSMLSEQLGRQTAKAGGIGIADRLLNPTVMAARAAAL